MSDIKSDATQDESTQPVTGHEAEELNEKELETVSGGRPSLIRLNPQPLPPFDGGL